MKHPFSCSNKSGFILFASFVSCLAIPLPASAASVALATAPLATSTTSSVKPNVMFILDDSGSMDWDYLPDWANDNHPVTGTNYTSMPELYTNNGFNGVAYNPAITYSPPVHYDVNGSLNTTTYPSQTGQTTATGADATTKPNWKAVKNDAYGVQFTGTKNLEGTASYYVFVPGEYCSTDRMTSCITATSPTTVSDVLYDKPAGLRWCNSAALTNCQSINNTTYKYPRYPGLLTGGAAATATITVTGGGTATSITVNGFQILKAATTSSGTTSTVATRIRDSINLCTAAISGNCTIAGYSATRSGSTVTITAPLALGTITFLPSVSGTMNKTISSFSGGSAPTTLPGSNLLTNVVSSNNAYPRGTKRTDCTTDTTDPMTCTYVEEMTNYANWWTYYHSRLQAMKTSVSRAFKTIDNLYRVGFTTISDTGATNNSTFLGNDTFELAHKNSWFTKLFATPKSGATPLRGALSKIGRYYGNKISGQVDPIQYSCQQNFTILSTDGYWNTNDETNTYKNINLTGGLIGNMDGTGIQRPMFEGPSTSAGSLADIAKYYYDTDLRNGPGAGTLNNCAGASSPDFPTGNPDVCTNEVYVSDSDNNRQQHMTTFTMGLGIDGTLNYTSDYDAARAGDFYDLKTGTGLSTVNWPNPITNTGAERIDDLWHAAVNGRGTYFSAKDPDQIIKGFTKALSDIRNKLGAAASASTSTLNPVAGNNLSFVASYTTNIWKGNLEARTINTGECTSAERFTSRCPDGVTNINAGVISDTATWCVESMSDVSCKTTPVADTSGSSTIYNCVETATATVADATACPAPGVFDAAAKACTTTTKTPVANKCVGTMPSRIAANSDTRTIYTAPAGGMMPLSGQNLVYFNDAYATANPLNFSASYINTLSQWGLITPPTSIETILINYLRGQNGYEDRTSNPIENRIFRTREAVLGDALESQPTYISKPVFSYPYPGYSEYKALKAGRTGTVFLGTNDGMLHAFAADTGVERWAYVPSMVIPDMWRLADFNYDKKHHNYVNGDPTTSDICVANCTDTNNAVWKTILVSGLNAGGRGFFALDITEPDVPVLLWEFTPSSGLGSVTDDDLGYSFGQPIITRKNDGTWVVLVTSGYDNGTLSDDPTINNKPVGSGIGYLYVLNAASGAIISKIATVTSAGANVGTPSSPSGFAKISGWNDEPAGNKAGYVYGGDLLGNVWRFDINSTVPAAIGYGDVLQFAKLYSDSLGTSPQPITTTPALGKISDYRVVFIGTGKYLEVSDLSTTQVQTQYAIKDDNSNATFVNPRNSLTQQTLSAATNRQSTGTTPDFYTGRGWYADFPDTGERANVDSILVQGILLSPTIVPVTTVCSPGGYSWLNYFNYKTGAVTSVKFDSTIVGLNVIFIAGKPLVEVVTSTDPTPTKPGVQPDFLGSQASFTKKRVIWRELIP